MAALRKVSRRGGVRGCVVLEAVAEMQDMPKTPPDLRKHPLQQPVARSISATPNRCTIAQDVHLWCTLPFRPVCPIKLSLLIMCDGCCNKPQSRVFKGRSIVVHLVIWPKYGTILTMSTPETTPNRECTYVSRWAVDAQAAGTHVLVPVTCADEKRDLRNEVVRLQGMLLDAGFSIRPDEN